MSAPNRTPRSLSSSPSPTSHAAVETCVPLLDLARENGPLQEEIRAAMDTVCGSGAFVLGPEVRKLEAAVAELSQTRHAVGCASGSDALLLSLMALDVGPGDEVILPSFTFFATASAVTRLGATPVFVDIEPDSFNLDVTLVEALITPATKAIIPVHLFGQAADMTRLVAIAKQHGLAVVEDAAQAIGAAHRQRVVGSWGDVGCISFYPTKNLGGFGDGGMLVTNDDRLADRLELLRGHGMRPRYVHREVGINSRLDSLQAAVLNVKLPHLAAWTAARQRNAQRYAELFAAHESLAELIGQPQIQQGNHHVWNQYTIRVGNGLRDALRQSLSERQIGSEIYYPIPLHRQNCFAGLGYPEGSLPQTERAAREVLSLPIHPFLTEAEQDAVVAQIVRFVGSNASRLNDYRAA